MGRTDLLRRTRFAAFALPVGLAGCAVMNIDVDVYKGPLANHKDVQTEQLAAMVVGAHPLLTRLFVIMAGPQKEAQTLEKQYTTRFPSVDVPADANDAKDACTYKPDTVSMIMCRAERAGALTQSTNYVIGRALRPTIAVEDDIRKREELQKAQLVADIIAVLRLYENRALTATEFDERVGGARDPNDKAAFALQQLLRQMGQSPLPRNLEQLSREVAKLIEPDKLRQELGRNPQLRPLQLALRREAGEAGYTKEGDFRKALEKVLNRYPIDASKDLLIATRIDVMPAITAKEAVDTAVDVARQGAQDSFFRGRLDVGIFDQVEAYLNANYASAAVGCNADGSSSSPLPHQRADCALAKKLRKDDVRAGMIEIKRDRLIKALNGFSQKVLSLANNVTLFAEQKRLDHEAGITERDKGDVELENLLKNYVRVLQTVGNSLLALADAMVQEDSHSARMHEAREAEVAAIQIARSQTPGTTYEQIIAVLESRVRSLESAKADAGKDAEGQALGAQLTQLKAKLEALPRTGTAVDSSEDMLRYAHAWVSLGADPRELSLPARPDLARSAAARAAVDAIVKKAAGAEQAYAAITEMLDQGRQAAAIKADAATVTRLRNALTVLKSDAFRNAVTHEPVPASAKEQAERISNQLRKLYADGSEAFLSAAAQRDKLVQEAGRLEGQLRAAARARPAASAEALQETIDAVYELRARREDFLPVLAKRNGAPVAAVVEHMERVASEPWDAKRVPPGPEAKLLLAMASGAPTSDERLRKQNAVKALMRVQLPAEIHANGLKPNPNTKDVFDELVAVLRHRHIAAVETYGPGSEQVARSSATLVEAYRQRAGMVYLRPAVSYLRTSFAATTLQNNLLAWSNLLEDHGKKSAIPWAPTAQTKVEQYVPTEIDKQFWQNVNQVKLSGVGSVNYAIAKDDIGNWYVKAYSADADSIIKSAKNLALFNLGARAGTDLLAAANAGADGTGTSAPPSGYARVFERFESKYLESTRKDTESLDAALEGTAEAIRKAWQDEPQTAAHVGVLEDSLKGPAAALKEARTALQKASGADTDSKKQPLARVNGLRALLRFESALAGNLRGSVASEARQQLKAAQERVRAKQAEISQTDAELVRAERREAEARSTVTGQGANVTEEATAALREATQSLAAVRRNRDQRADELQPLIKAEAATQAEVDAKARAEGMAAQRANELVRGKIAALLTTRQRTVAEFENAVAAIGDARSQAPARDESLRAIKVGVGEPTPVREK